MRRIMVWGLVSLLILSSALALEAAAMQGVGRGMPGDSLSLLEARTSAVAARLRCPVCQGLSIEDSPTELALEMRAVIRDQLAEGRTAEEVEEYFVSKYGEWVLLEPKPEGFNLAVYALPIVALVFGGSVVGLAVRRWTRQGGERYKDVGV